MGWGISQVVATKPFARSSPVTAPLATAKYGSGTVTFTR